MNGYDGVVTFRQAEFSDISRVMSFIKGYWRNDHILGTDLDFFLYEHGDDKKINFIICEDRKDNDIVGIHGFIPYGNLDTRQKHVCGVMTMVKKNTVVPMLGVELIKRFANITNYKTYCGIGTNPNTMTPIAEKIFGRFIGKMSHYYQLNENMGNFRIAKITDRKNKNNKIENNNFVKLIELNNFKELDNSFDLNIVHKFLPYKEGWYIEKRYYNHPVYKYRVWGVQLDGVVVSLLFGREITYNNSYIMRFVDYIGEIDDLWLAGEGIKKIINNGNYEYADFLLHGVPEKIMNKCGFVKKEEHDRNIIPTYFEPFVNENVDIWYELSHNDLVIFKGDADADRPNYRLK